MLYPAASPILTVLARDRGLRVFGFGRAGAGFGLGGWCVAGPAHAFHGQGDERGGDGQDHRSGHHRYHSPQRQVGGRCGRWGRRRDRSARRLRQEPARRGGGKADRWGQEDRQPAERCEGPAVSGDAASCGARLRWCWSVVHLGDSFGCLGGCFWVACSAHRQCNAGGVESAWGRLGTTAWNGGGPVAGTAVEWPKAAGRPIEAPSVPGSRPDHRVNPSVRLGPCDCGVHPISVGPVARQDSLGGGSDPDC